MGGALPFTNMQNLRTENNEDGTYRYEDFTQDGQILVVNTVEPTRLVPEVQDLEDYLIACAFALSDTDTYELLSAEENEEYTENLTYPVYIVTYIAGEKEDTQTVIPTFMVSVRPWMRKKIWMRFTKVFFRSCI